ncbi:MAG: alpha-galactosidase [Thermoleophilaceae bacterium]|nr:alpha-galactosidase [Thermoleophilaceae bacterium]
MCAPAALAAACALPCAARAAGGSLDSADVYATYDATGVALGNGVVERRWSRSPFRTTSLTDKRSGGRTWSRGGADFVLEVGGAQIPSDDFAVQSVQLGRLARGGVRVTMHLAGSGAASGLTADRVAEAYPGVAGFRTQTTLTSATPLVLSAATLDQAAVGRATPALRNFRAGSDWRDPAWNGPPLWVGYSQPGDYRQDTTAAAGTAVEGNAEWLDARSGERSLFMALERNDLPSSRAAYDGSNASLRVDYTKDVLDLGPFEEQIHVENPSSGGGRTRTLRPGEPFALEATFTGMATSTADEGWQWHHYLAGHRTAPYPHTVSFNSDSVDTNAHSTGSKDDMDFKTLQAIAPIAKRLGVETFILDDGWASRDGDWQPDSPQYPEPRYASDPQKFAPRFPDAQFKAVHATIGDMKLGLWMSPLMFHPSSQTFQSHPDWACHPIADPLIAQNAADPSGTMGTTGSNEAGIGPWGDNALPHIESRIRDAIDHWGVRFFKFDFMVWLDCPGQNDLYEQHDAFVAMIDRLRRDHPDVTFQIDETNDYRMFPFESTSRGPTWFQNGAPDAKQLLHNLWSLSPFIPAYAIGQHVLSGPKEDVSTLMAAALPSEITFKTDLRKLSGDTIATARRWIDFYKAHRDSFSLATHPLLDDPVKGGWTALQEWDSDAQRGALLAFRQGSDSSSKHIALVGVRPGLRFRLFEGPAGQQVATATSADLTHGIDVKLSGKGLARVLLIEPVKPPPPGISVQRGGKVSHACRDTRKFRFRLHHSRRARVVEVYAYVNGRRRLHRRGHSLRRIVLRKLPTAKFRVRIETFQSNGNETISVRRFDGCRKGKPRTRRGHGRHGH